MTDHLDGAIGEAWAGEVPNGSHVNLVVARRGSPTAAAAAGALASPGPGHAPFLVCLSAGTMVRPPTIVVNKSTIDDDRLRRITWGAAQLGIAQGVLDAVAEGLIDAEEADELVLLVALWVDPAADDETGRRAGQPRGDPRRDRGRAGAAHAGHDARPRRAARGGGERLLRRGRLSVRIAGVEVRRYARRVDPPFRAAWDPEPRASLEASLVIVRSDDGLAGYASGDRLPDAALLERLLVGLDPLRTEVVRELCETVDFHGGRPWTAEVAVWDLAARALGEPLWRLLGGRSERLLAYASSGELVDAEERARRVAALRDAGVRAVKLRFHHADWRDDVEVVEAVRDAVGDGRRADGRREPGLAHGGRPLAALGRRDRRAVRAGARAARRLLARGAAAHRRRRGLRGAAAADVAADRGRRDGPRRRRGARPRCCAAAST